MRSYRLIAIIGGSHAGTDAAILRGLHKFARPTRRWVFDDHSGLGHDEHEAKRALSLKPDAVVARVQSEGLKKMLVASKLPVVDLSGFLPEKRFLWADVDDEAAGRMAASYFVERGFRKFAYVGYVHYRFAKSRMKGFSEELKRRGYGHETWAPPHGVDYVAQNETLRDFLSGLSFPTAVYVSHDTLAGVTADACLAANLRVPEQVAILGNDNNELVCEMSFPPLSSVSFPSERLGWEVGQVLDRVFAGKGEARGTLILPPTGVVTRQSTDVVAVDDAYLSSALKFVRERATDGIQVKAVLKEVPVSRVWLARRFQEVLQRTVLQEIHRVRVEEAKKLLLGSNWPMPEIALRSGFRDAMHLATIFRKVVGETASAYRRRGRMGGAGLGREVG